MKIKKMLAGLFLMVGAVSILAADYVLKLNFADPTAVQSASLSNNPKKPNERASGKILKPFADNTSWCKVWTEYDILTENGTKFQRIDVKKIEPKDENDKTSCGQIVAHLDDFQGKASFKLQFKARSSTSSDIKAMVRVRPEPYTKLWGATINLTPEWKEYKYEFEVENKEDSPVSFYIQIPKVGVVDISEFSLEKK